MRHDIRLKPILGSKFFPLAKASGNSKGIMTFKTKIYIGIAVAIAFASLVAGVWQSHTINKLENAVRDANQSASDKQDHAAARELEAAEYKQKIEYLEQTIAEIQKQTRRQDEKLETATNNSRIARGDVERAKRTRAGQANTAELCAKLAELGHDCQ